MSQLDSVQFRLAERDHSYGAGTALQRLIAPGLVAGAVIWGLVCGLLAIQASPLAVLGGLTMLAILFYRPEYFILLLLLMTSSVFEQNMVPTISVGFKFTAVELCLMLLLGVVALKSLAPNTKSGFLRTPLDLPVALFFVAGTMSFFNAQYNQGTDRGWLVPQWRIVFDYLVFFAVTNFVRTRRQFHTVAYGVLGIAVLTAALSVLQAALGTSLRILPSGLVAAANVFTQQYTDVPRVIVAGTPLIFIMLPPALIMYSMAERARKGKVLLLTGTIILLLVAIAFTFDRTWWVGTGAALVVLVFVISGYQRASLLRRLGALAAIFLLLVTIAIAFVPQAGHVVEVMGLRAGSLLTGQEIVNDSGTQWRLREISSAVDRIQEHPLLGVGPGGRLREPWWNGDILTRFMHNSYLFILADLGIVGLLPFLWFSIAFLIRGFSRGRRLRDPSLRVWVLGLTLGYVALMVASISGPEFMSWETVPTIGVILALNEVAIRLGDETNDTVVSPGHPLGSTAQHTGTSAEGMIAIQKSRAKGKQQGGRLGISE